MRLLVSVIDATEVEAALAGGADVIDVKNPAAGPMGAAAPEIVRGVRRLVAGAVPVSAALGDLPDDPWPAARAAEELAACGVQYLKVACGAGLSARTAAAMRLAIRAVDPRIELVVAGYADTGPAWPELVALAREAGASGCLIDTARKQAGNLWRWLAPEEARAYVAACHAAGIMAALAGSLTPADLPLAAAAGADLIGVRGAACDGDRVAGRVSAGRVSALRGALGLSPAGV